MRETSNRFSKKVCRYQRLPTKKAFRNIQQNVLLDNTQWYLVCLGLMNLTPLRGALSSSKPDIHSEMTRLRQR